jgi:exonuclease SbcC
MVTDTNKKIVSFLRLDYSTYVNSVYLRQDDIFSFADGGTNKEGRDILEKVLSLEEYDLFHEEAKANVKRISREIETIEMSISSNSEIDEKIEYTNSILKQKRIDHLAAKKKSEDMLGQINAFKEKLLSLASEKEEFQKAQFGIRELELSVESLKSEANALIRNFNTLSDSTKIKSKELQDVIDSLPEIKKKVDEHKESVNLNNTKRLEVDELVKSVATFKSDNISLSGKVVLVSSEFKTLQRQLVEVKGERDAKASRMETGPDSVEVCPECLTEITEATVEHFKNHLSKDIKILNNKIDELSKKALGVKVEEDLLWNSINSTNENISSIENRKNNLSKTLLSDSQISEREIAFKKEIASIDKAKSELNVINTSDELSNLKASVESKKALYLLNKSELESKKALIISTQFDDSKIKTIESSISLAGEELDLLKERVHILSAEIKTNESAVESFDIIKKEIDEHKMSIDEKKKDLSIYMRLQEAFSSKGIRADIIQNAIGELERHSNELLGKLTSGRLSVEFVTRKEVKASKGEQVEKVVFEVVVNDGEEPLPFHLYSGGEKFRVAFVLRVALAQLLQRRANSKLEFLIIDEAFSPLDQNGIEKNLAVIDELQNEFKTILVITHRNDIKQYFDQVITVARDLDGSRIL